MMILNLNKQLILVALATLITLTIYPFELTVIPEWEFKLVDTDDNSLPAMKVLQIWHDPLVEANVNQEETASDKNGYVRLPERTVRASILRRVFTKIKEWQTAGDESQSYSYITIESEDYYIHNGLYGIYRKGVSMEMGTVMRHIDLPVHTNNYSEETAQFRHEGILLCNVSLEQRDSHSVLVASEPLTLGTSNGWHHRAEAACHVPYHAKHAARLRCMPLLGHLWSILCNPF